MIHQKADQAVFSLADAKYLRASLNPETPTFVLIDPMLGEPLPTADIPCNDADLQSMREAMWHRSVTPIELSQRTKLPPHQHPYLVAMQGITDPLLETTLAIAHSERLQAQIDGLAGEGAAAHRIGGWLQSTMHSPQLAAHLSVMLQVNTAVPTTSTYLRLIDRRTLALIRHVTGDAGIINQFGRLQSWVYLDVQGSISALKSSGEHTTTLRLDHHQWSRMQEGEMLNRTLAQWLGEARRLGQTHLCERPAQTLYEPLFKAVASARQAAKLWPHRFSLPIDQSIWAALSLLYPALEKEPAVGHLLQNTRLQDEPPEPLRYLHGQVSEIMSKTSPLIPSSHMTERL